ncbi:MAG: tail fiber domain-containing protein [candidate division Zixibacteria bacterium]|nr:tail fiber domain-containing protein [candidate division Zixibacteria bacterium]
MSRLRYVIVVIVCLMTTTLILAGAAPQLLNYQAVLLDGDGNPVTTEVSVKFAIYDAASGPTELWSETANITPNNDGAFDHILGQQAKGPIDDSVFEGSDRWLGITVGADAELSPRTRLVSSAYSMRVSTIDNADAGVVHGGLVVAPTEEGRGDDATLNIQDSEGINVITMDATGDTPLLIVKGPGGDDLTQVSGAGVDIVTSSAKGVSRVHIAQDGIYFLNETLNDTNMVIYADGDIMGKGKVTIGGDHDASAQYANVFGYGNTVLQDSSSILGGYDNIVDGRSSAIGAGHGNSITGNNSFIGAGKDNHITGGASAFIGSGNVQKAMSTHSTVVGGYGNVAGSFRCFIGCGSENVAGDSLDLMGSYGSIVGCGYNNTAIGILSSIIGGELNTASHDHAVCAGGFTNTAAGQASFVGSGSHNYISSDGFHGVICGGEADTVSDWWATVLGGKGNVASGRASLAHGFYCRAEQENSYAFGRFAHSKHMGSIVFSDASLDTVESTGYNQFLIRAGGGVGINLNDPTEDIDINGTARLRGIAAGAGQPVLVDGNGVLWKGSSSERYKDNIETLSIDAEAILKLRPVSFQWKNGTDDIGLIAEEVATQIPELVFLDNEGRPEGVKYDKLAIYLLDVVSELRSQNAQLRDSQTTTNAKLEQLTEMVEILLAQQDGNDHPDLALGQ